MTKISFDFKYEWNAHNAKIIRIFYLMMSIQYRTCNSSNLLHFFCSTRKDLLHSMKKKKFNDYFFHSMKMNFNDYFLYSTTMKSFKNFLLHATMKKNFKNFLFHSNKWLLTKNSCSFRRKQMTMNIVNLHWNASKSHFHLSISISIFILILALIFVLILFSILLKILLFV